MESYIIEVKELRQSEFLTSFDITTNFDTSEADLIAFIPIAEIIADFEHQFDVINARTFKLHLTKSLKPA